MGKLSKEEAKAKLASLKEERKAAKEELRAFEKENKLAKETDHGGHEKFGKRWTKLNDAYQKKVAAIEKLEAEMAEIKTEKKSRVSTYEYPADVKTAAEKKKHRAKMRAEKKRAEKGEAAPKKEKKEKGAKTEEVKEEKSSSKKDKKSKKEKGASED